MVGWLSDQFIVTLLKIYRERVSERVGNISVVGREGDWNVTLSLFSLSLGAFYQSVSAQPLPIQAARVAILGSGGASARARYAAPPPPFTLLTFPLSLSQPRSKRSQEFRTLCHQKPSPQLRYIYATSL